MSQLTYVAVDPGEHIGLVGYDEKGSLLWIQEILIKELTDFMSKWSPAPKKMIVERYRPYPGKERAHTYSDLKTARVIGRLEYYAEMHGAKVVFQGADIKALGFKYLGVKEPPRSDKLMNAKVAHAHGTYYLVTKGILDGATLLKESNKRNN
jgi:hypothetical protein